ncbi:hypothetical protein HY633_00180 [Candidatus Uhrbacteria bacterium]|nr:hypothetical protein [Candidatus Uhrbacteria bacterium]
MHDHAAKTADPKLNERFWKEEREYLAARNRTAAARFASAAAEIARRRDKSVKILVTCMDERNTHVEEALGLLPGEADVFASGGGKTDFAAIERIFGSRISSAVAAGKPVSIFLTPHECSHDANLGCAAFGNDTAAQKQFFTALKNDIVRAFPSVVTHVMALCTTTHKLREIDCHDAAECLIAVRGANAFFDRHAKDVGHAGYGIYVGDAYRAWVGDRNRYFRLSSLNPSLEGNIGIALTVMEHHSDVDLAATPAVLHIDYPRHQDDDLSAAVRENIDRATAPFLNRSDLHVIKTETDVANWQGRMLS